MKFAFFGSPAGSAIVLEKLLDAGYIPSISVCNPDRPVGRKQIITAPETKQLILRRELADTVTILQPAKVSEIIPQLTALQPDFFVVAAYAKIIPQSLLDIPRLGTIGVHPSLLPAYRGSSPIQSALLNGETVSGVSLYLLQAGMDDGPVFVRQELAIDPYDTDATLAPKLWQLGGDMLVKLLPEFLTGTAQPVPQDHASATFTKKFTTEDAFISKLELDSAIAGGASASPVYNRIRAFTPQPGAWTIKNGKRIKLLAARLEEVGGDGAIVPKLELLTIQKEGKTPEEFRGF